MKTNMPLPLELTRPVALPSDLDTLLSLDAGSTKYNHETQMRPPEMWGGRRHHNTSSKCVNNGFIQIDDVLQDFSL